MNKEELKEYLSDNLKLEVRNDLRGNPYLTLKLEDEMITFVNLSEFINGEPDLLI